MKDRELFKKGHLVVRPEGKPAIEKFTTGLHPLNLDTKRDCFIYIPQNYNHNFAASLALMMHGAGGDSAHGLSLIQSYADDNNIIILLPYSRLYSCDIIASDSFGPDVFFINRSLEYAFRRFNINTSRIAIGGFSDGASYALCLGLGNGDLFTHILAFSPGFYYTIENRGKPSVFISHGTEDHILPINSCSRRIVPRLKNLGYNVRYEEFRGRAYSASRYFRRCRCLVYWRS